MNELGKRCGMICGEDRTGCFAANTRHLECITDIIINKIWAARAIIDIGTRDTDCERMTGILHVATTEMDELIDWVTYMQREQKKRSSAELLCRR
jgi:hypothetical protein